MRDTLSPAALSAPLMFSTAVHGVLLVGSVATKLFHFEADAFGFKLILPSFNDPLDAALPAAPVGLVTGDLRRALCALEDKNGLDHGARSGHFRHVRATQKYMNESSMSNWLSKHGPPGTYLTRNGTKML